MRASTRYPTGGAWGVSGEFSTPPGTSGRGSLTDGAGSAGPRDTETCGALIGGSSSPHPRGGSPPPLSPTPPTPPPHTTPPPTPPPQTAPLTTPLRPPKPIDHLLNAPRETPTGNVVPARPPTPGRDPDSG